MDDFNFSDPKVLETLLAAKGRGMEFVGSAMSDFQSHPHLDGEKYHDRPRSDWEMQVHRMVLGKPNKILGKQDVSDLPEFFDRRESYVKRSAELGENMFRLSLDFGRLCPEPGAFDRSLMKEYVKALASIRLKRLEPMLTFYHWPMPAHLLRMKKSGKIAAGAWEHPDVLRHFSFYVKTALHHLGDKDFIREALESDGYSDGEIEALASEGLVRYFVSVNEPVNILLPTYISGIFPPFKKMRFDLLSGITSNLVEAHHIVLSEVKVSNLPVARGPLLVGAAHNWTYFDGLLGGLAHHLVNRRLIAKFERGRKESDFIGLQYYFRMNLSLLHGKRVFSDDPYFGDVYPRGAYKALSRIHNVYPKKDIFITEFGFSDSNGLRRPYWILETMRYAIEAFREGLPVKGILAWTLADSFEWNLGMGQRFGLFAEKELGAPLRRSEDGGVKSWEAWQAVVKSILDPNEENLFELQCAYEIAERQFKAATAG